MTPALAHLRAEGAQISLAGPDRIACRVPAGRRDLVDFARAHKPTLLVELRTEALRRGEYDLPDAEPDPAETLRAWLQGGLLADIAGPVCIARGVNVFDPERAARSFLLGMAAGERVAQADRLHAERFIAAVRPLIERVRGLE